MNARASPPKKKDESHSMGQACASELQYLGAQSHYIDIFPQKM